MHDLTFNTDQFGDYVITFDTSGNCKALVNGKDRIKSKLSTNLEPYSNSPQHIRQAIKHSSDFSTGRIRCIEKRSWGNQMGVVELSFDPMKIENGVAVYEERKIKIESPVVREALQPGEVLENYRVDITLDSERESGISVPGGACSYIMLRSPAFTLEKRKLDNGHDEYTVTGRGRFWCGGLF